MTKFVIGKDRISVIETENYVSGTQDAYKCAITFSKDWEGLTRKISFRSITGPNLCDEIYASVPAPALSMKMVIPNKLFISSADKLQISASGYRGNKADPEKMLRTPWTTLGRIIEGACAPCPPEPDNPDEPSPPSSDIIPPGGTKDQVLAKASDDDYDFYWMSVSSLPVVTSAGVSAPLKTVMYFAGDLSEIPEGWAFCDGQNGTPDLRGKVIVGYSEVSNNGEAEDQSVASNNVSVFEAGLAEDTAITLYSLYPIMNLSAEPSGGTPGKSAYQIAVDDGFVGTEQEWLKSLEGASAYELAVQAGFLGSQETFSNTLKTLASFPVVSGLTITSAKELPADGDGCYIFENVTVGSHTFARQIVYLSTTTPNHIRVTLLSGTVYDFTTSTSETEAILIEDVYEQSIPIPTFTDVTFANRSDVFTRNALGTIHLVDSRFDLDGYSSIIQFKNDIAYLERYSNDFTLYTQNGRWYSFTLGEEQRFVYTDSGTFRDKSKAVDVSFDDTTANLGATNVQSAIEALAARPSGGGGDTPSDFTPVTQFKPAAGSAGPFILSSAKPFLNISGATVRFTYASLQLPDGTNIHSFEDEFVYVKRLPSQVLEFYMSDGEVVQITYKDTTKDFVSFKMEESIYENVFTLVKNKLITSTTELYAAFEQNVSKCYHLKNMSFQKIGDKAWFFKDDVVSVTWVNGSEVCYVNGLDRTLRLTWDNSAGTAFTAVELVETAASDVTFDDSTAKLGATDVQTAVDSLAEAIPIIKDKTFRKTSDLAEYNAGMTYRMINVQFLDSKGINIVTFANDPVYVRELQSPTGSGFTPALYTMDGYRFDIIADSQGDFTSSSVTDAFEGAALDSLPFQIIENATITSLSQLMDLGITSDEMFFARNVSFKLPDESTSTIRITGNDWVQVSWNLSMSLKVYSTDANWHIEWNSSEDTKPFTKIENWNNREGLPTVVGVTASNISDLLSLRMFFGYAMKLRGLTIITSAGGSSQRSYDNDVAYATNDETNKTVTITRLNNKVDVFTYDDTGEFTSVTTKELDGSTEVTLPFPVITDKSFASIAELEAAGITSGQVFYAERVVFNTVGNTNKMFSIRYGDFVKVTWAVSLVVRILGSDSLYFVNLDNDTEGQPFEGYQDGYADKPLTTVTASDIATVAALKSECDGLDNSTAYFYNNASIKVGEQTIQIKERVADVKFNDGDKTVLISFVDGTSYTLTYGDDGVFTAWSYSQNGTEELTFADGLTKTDGTVSLDMPVRDLTKEEYEALSEDDKAKGLIFIPADGNSGSNSGSNTGGDAFANVYDGEERVIGTWFGKPLYRKCYQVNDFIIKSTTMIEIDAYSSEMFVHAHGVLTIPEGQQCLLPYSESNIITISITAYGGKVYIVARSTTERAATNCYVILEYIKTTG